MEYNFIEFIKERPAICITKLAKEIDIDRVNLSKIILGYRNIPKKKKGVFLQIMNKYGYRISLDMPF